jgi:hypothetical protein
VEEGFSGEAKLFAAGIAVTGGSPPSGGVGKKKFSTLRQDRLRFHSANSSCYTKFVYDGIFDQKRKESQEVSLFFNMFLLTATSQMW